jgi:hypothetical protein
MHRVRDVVAVGLIAGVIILLPTWTAPRTASPAATISTPNVTCQK